MLPFDICKTNRDFKTTFRLVVLNQFWQLFGSLNANNEDKQKTSERLGKFEEKTNSGLAALEKENNKLSALVKEIENKNLYLEAYSRRENVKFENIPEEDPKEDTEMVLRSFLERELGFSDAANIEIQRVHRLLRKKERRETPTHPCQVSKI